MRRFRLKCTNERRWYEEAVQEIDREIKVLKEKRALSSIGKQTKNELTTLIDQYEQKRLKKQQKLDFYVNCEERLQQIEEQIEVRKLLEDSKRKLNTIRRDGEGSSKDQEVAKEFELFNYYGKVLADLSDNLKKVEEDNQEEMEELELKEILAQIKVKS